MIRPGKVRIIASWEFACVVRRLPFLIFTFGMPIVMGVLFGGIGMLESRAVAVQAKSASVWGLVVVARGLSPPPDERVPQQAQDDLAQAGFAGARAAESHGTLFVSFADEPAARRELDRKRIAGYFVVAERYLDTGAVRLVTRGDGATATFGSVHAERALGTVLRRRLLAGKLPGPVMARVLEPVVAERTMVSERGAERMDDDAELRHITVPLLLAILMLMSLLSTSSYLVQGVAIEKENKLVEVLLSSASADEILAGKLLGLGAAGLCQVGVWCAMLAAVALPTRGMPSGLYVPWHAVAAAVPLFLLGYLFIGSLMLATGSLGSSLRESQQLAMAWMVPTMLPLFLMSALLPEPHGLLARVLSWIPFTAPLTIVTRLSLDPDGIAGWEIFGAAAVLALSTWLAVRLAARLFRVGLLLTGARPKLGDLLRQAAIGR